MKPIKLYWSKSLKDGHKNFGDWLSPVLCEFIAKRPVIWTAPEKCDLAAVGSVLRKLKKNWFQRRIHVWGSGQIEQGKPYKSYHYYHAIRGKLSAKQIINQNIIVYGDPALLCSSLIKSGPKKYDVGLIPHYKDQKNELISLFEKKHKGTKVIDVFAETISFIKQVAECKIVISSSLHGLIVADALSIPNAWISLSNLVRGDGFKFYDYYSAFEIKNIFPFSFDQHTTMEDLEKMACSYSRPNIDNIKKNLLNSFPSF